MSASVAEDGPWDEESNPDKDSDLESLNGSSEEGDELTQRIVAQLELYFSDENILHDIVPPQTRTPQPRGLCQPQADSVLPQDQESHKELGAGRQGASLFFEPARGEHRGHQVRRYQPLPDQDETALSRTVVAYPLPARFTFKAVADMFSCCGTISLLSLLMPGDPVPPCVRRFLQTHPDATGCPVALVEFEQHQGACQALRQNGRFLRVVPLAPSSSTAAVLATRVAKGSPSRGAVPPSASGPLTKSQSQGDTGAGPWVKKRTDGSVQALRQPRGPAGTRGFNYPRSTIECQLLAPAP